MRAIALHHEDFEEQPEWVCDMHDGQSISRQHGYAFLIAGNGQRFRIAQVHSGQAVEVDDRVYGDW